MGMGGAGNSVYQTGFRARNDDGDESSATWKEALSTDWDQLEEENFRLRILTERDVTLNGWFVEHKLLFSWNGGAYQTLTKTSVPIYLVHSTHFTDGEDTTQQIGTQTFTDPTNEGMISGTYDNQTAQMFYTAGLNQEFEFEVCARISSALVSKGDTIDFEGWDATAGSAYTGGYTVIPRLTIVKRGNAVRIKRLDDDPKISTTLRQRDFLTARIGQDPLFSVESVSSKAAVKIRKVNDDPVVSASIKGFKPGTEV